MGVSRRTNKRKAISEMIAILVVITILVGVAIAVAMLTGSFVQKVRPTGGGLVITGAVAKKLSPSRVAITLSLQNTGSETINIASITVYDQNGNRLTTTIMTQPGQSLPSILPNQVVAIGLTVSSSSTIGDYSQLNIVIQYSTVTGTTGSVSGTVVVEPG